MPKTYTTKMGDTWDIVSLINYGTEVLVSPLVEANWPHRAVAVFSAGVVLHVPEVTQGAAYDTNLPPWRRT